MDLAEEKSVRAEDERRRAGVVICSKPGTMESANGILSAPVESDVAADEDVRTSSNQSESPYVVSCKHKRFLICTLIALGILVAYNMLIHRIARTSQRQQLMAALERIPADTDCLFIG